MLEKSDIPDALILEALQLEYGLAAARVEFLPLGADAGTAVYRVETLAGPDYFLKLRKGPFDSLAVEIPRYLRDRGVQAVISPLETRGGSLWGRLGEQTAILYPFVAGQNGYQASLSDRQWVALGAALQQIHSLDPPPALRERLPLDTFAAQARDQVSAFLEQARQAAFAEEVAAKLAAFMQAQSEKIAGLVRRGEALAAALRARPPERVLCHSDLHPGNLHLPLDAPDRLYLVDWDNPTLAPKEKDLMFLGAGMGYDDPRQASLFYQGYSPGYRPAETNPVALAYYRCERVILDIAAFCEQLFLSTEGDEDRWQSYRYFTGQFQPGQEVDRALGSGGIDR